MKSNKNSTPLEVAGEKSFNIRKRARSRSEMSKTNKPLTGFTLIELLVVVAIIGLLSSIALIALIQARAKSRDAKRLGDMTQMNTGLELYFAANKEYPSSTNGIPAGMSQFVVRLPTAPMPEDGACSGLSHSTGGASQPPAGIPANTYYYMPAGSIDPVTGLYPDYAYYFCLGNQTGNFAAGERILTPTGLK